MTIQFSPSDNHRFIARTAFLLLSEYMYLFSNLFLYNPIITQDTPALFFALFDHLKEV